MYKCTHSRANVCISQEAWEDVLKWEVTTIYGEQVNIINELLLAMLQIGWKFDK